MSTNFVSYANAEAIITVIGQKFSALGGAYKVKGSKAFADLPSVSTATVNDIGNVYNVTDAFTTTADFVEGAGKKYPAGTNVVIVDASTVAYNAVTPVGTENPSEEGWYELVNDEYVLSEDTEINSGKTYYEKVTTEAYKYDVLGNFIDVDAIEARIDKVAKMVTGFFDDTIPYNEGDVVIYEDDLYKFIVNHPAGGWNVIDVEPVTVIDLIDAAEPDALTSEQVNALIALLG